ncbi:MAG: hypothetical protein R2795_00440 [Saprospiraceae bacterium]
MNKKHLYFAGIGLLVIALAVWAMQAKQQFSWRETYKTDKKEPYDLYAVHKILGSLSEATN